jgi:hypothetical protein
VNVRRWPALGVLLLLGYVAAGEVVPLYDGIGFPDQPYRYVTVPPGVTKHGPAAQGAHANSPAANGTNTDVLVLQTAEQGPQVTLSLPPAIAKVPITAKRITATATPLAPDRQPADGAINGNIYRIGVTSDVGPGTFAPDDGQDVVYLRAVAIKATPPVMEYRPTPDAPWRRMETGRTGADVMLATFLGPGDYALVDKAGGAPAKRGHQNATAVPLLAGVLVLAMLTLLAVRRTVRRDQ